VITGVFFIALLLSVFAASKLKGSNIDARWEICCNILLLLFFDFWRADEHAEVACE